jgi:hypothetical protein
MTTTLATELVKEFAASVRRELLDLGADTVDDLTDGLEADLADKVADGEPLGDPIAYAAELRAAAGLSVNEKPKRLHALREKITDLRERLSAVAAHPAIAPVLGFVLVFRPLWWIVRGCALFYLLNGSHTLPLSGWDAILLIALLVLSVQWGRGRWLPWKWSRRGVIALSVVALLVVPSFSGAVVDRLTFSDRFDVNDYVSDGLLLGKEPVSNIFAYGPDGQLLTDVRLFDQSGRPLSVVDEVWGDYPYWADGDAAALVPSRLSAGSPGWNVYPLSSVAGEDLNEDGLAPDSAPRIPATAPFATLQPLLGQTAVPAAGDPTPAPSSTNK